MSGFVALIQTDGSHAPAHLLTNLLPQIAHRGKDNSQTWCVGAAGMAAAIQRTTPESSLEQPVTVSRYGTALVYDGRLDNRDELLRSLGKSGMNNAPDPILILEAYEAWGPKFASRLLGDYAFLLWDKRRCRTLAVRDRLGLKPLHYAQTKDGVLFCSEIKPILSALKQPVLPNDGMILSFLSYACFTEFGHGETFFKNVHRLPPAHFLLLEDGKMRLERYWHPDLMRQNQFRSETECAEAFQEILRESVNSRMRAPGATGILLSGGLDSSTIAALASGNASSSLEAYHQYSHDPLAEERPYARQIAKRFGIPLYEFFTHSADPVRLGLDRLLYELEAPMVGTGQDREIFQFAEARGTRVVLSGEGGDHLLDEFGFPADLLRRGKWLDYLKKVYRFAGDFDIPLAPVIKESFSHMLPQSLIRLRRRLLRNAPPRWLNDNLVRQTGLWDLYFRSSQPEAKAQSIVQATTYRDITHPYSVMKWELEEKLWARYGADLRLPMLDTRLVEFVLAMPWRYRATGRRKAVLRCAFKNILPAGVVERRSKSDWTAEMDEALHALCRAPVPEPLANRSGILNRYVDQKQVKVLVDRYLQGHYDLRSQVWFLITVDHWLAQFTQGVFHEGPSQEEKVPVSSPR